MNELFQFFHHCFRVYREPKKYFSEDYFNTPPQTLFLILILWMAISSFLNFVLEGSEFSIIGTGGSIIVTFLSVAVLAALLTGVGRLILRAGFSFLEIFLLLIHIGAVLVPIFFISAILPDKIRILGTLIQLGFGSVFFFVGARQQLLLSGPKSIALVLIPQLPVLGLTLMLASTDILKFENVRGHLTGEKKHRYSKMAKRIKTPTGNIGLYPGDSYIYSISTRKNGKVNRRKIAFSISDAGGGKVKIKIVTRRNKKRVVVKSIPFIPNNIFSATTALAIQDSRKLEIVKDFLRILQAEEKIEGFIRKTIPKKRSQLSPDVTVKDVMIAGRRGTLTIVESRTKSQKKLGVDKTMPLRLLYYSVGKKKAPSVVIQLRKYRGR